jgi:uncharacterized SAM-binding protein YcdF (DUF218 family)
MICFIIFLNLGNFLDLANSPKESDIIVVLGGGKDIRIKKGLELYKKNYSLSRKIIFTSDNLYHDSSMIFYRYEYLVKNGVKEDDIIHIDQTRVSNTMEEIIEIKNYLTKNNMRSVLFVTHPSHTLRIKILANLLENYDKKNINISFASADHTHVWSSQYYFLEWESIKLVLLEYLKIVYNLIKYSIFL